MVDLSNEHLTTILETIKKSSEETSAAVTSQLKEYFKEETEKLLNKINEQAHKIEILEERCTKIEENQIKFERFIKRKNLIIFGARYNKDNNNILQFTLDLLQKYLNVQITENDIDNIYTLNNVSSKKRATNQSRICDKSKEEFDNWELLQIKKYRNINCTRSFV